MILALTALYVVLGLAFLVSAKRAPLGVQDESGFRLADETPALVPVVVTVPRARAVRTATTLT